MSEDAVLGLPTGLQLRVIAGHGRRDLAARHRQAAVLFIDIAGFTRLSQQLGPTGSAELLRGFHRIVEAAVHAEGGVVTGLMGDGAMAVFGLRHGQADDPVRALAAARALVDALAARKVPVGIGVHCGPVAIEEIGGQAQVQTTAIGDTVNLASRLEDLTRQHQAAIAISATLADMVRTAGRPDLLKGFRLRKNQPIRGWAGSIDLWLLPLQSA